MIVTYSFKLANSMSVADAICIIRMIVSPIEISFDPSRELHITIAGELPAQAIDNIRHWIEAEHEEMWIPLGDHDTTIVRNCFAMAIQKYGAKVDRVSKICNIFIITYKSPHTIAGAHMDLILEHTRELLA